ncbi:LacI family DNA-binding transcriptional regulator [Frankia sp. Cr1]|uniref:LacI family DNA-binding transcriptional regulator n=1 Tax=Frankia sp. Cr1 TaxID=3073931 RepID=UPI002AD3B502|nr:LacI family DNA-binding transcriptional regulator [Frankia sp. Cr1]
MSGSIEEVAALAGVSTATVSRALRGLPNVAESTRIRVVAAAAQLLYVASPQASRLASGRTGTVGVVVPYVTRWFFAQIISGAEAVLRAGGLDLLLYNLGDDAGRARFFDAVPLRKRVDAVLVLCLPLTPMEIEVLQALNVPVVVVGAAVPGFAGVRIDDVAGATVAVRHLINLGHRRIGLISGGATGEGSDDREPMRFTAPTDRRRGYRHALRSAGIPLDSRLEAAGHFTVRGGEQAMAELLSAQAPPTAVFAESDEMAMGALRTLRRAGLRVPDDLSVVGFDGHEMAELFDLTTIVQPVVRQGEIAAQLLLSLLRQETPASTGASGDDGDGGGGGGGGGGEMGGSADDDAAGESASADTRVNPAVPISIVVPTSIHVRGTTCPPRGQGNDVSPTVSDPTRPASPDAPVM